MRRLALSALLAVTMFTPTAQASDCGVQLDELAKAISGHLTMSPDKKASMLRMATTGYDHCIAGDDKYAGATRDMIMKQIKESLGGR